MAFWRNVAKGLFKRPAPVIAKVPVRHWQNHYLSNASEEELVERLVIFLFLLYCIKIVFRSSCKTVMVVVVAAPRLVRRSLGRHFWQHVGGTNTGKLITRPFYRYVGNNASPWLGFHWIPLIVIAQNANELLCRLLNFSILVSRMSPLEQ